MADYTRYSAPAGEWTEFEKTRSPPVAPPGTSLEQAREMFNNTRTKLFAKVLGPVYGVTSEEVSITTSDGCSLPVRIYRPRDATGKLPLYIHLHGGGFHLGNLDTEDPGCRLISLRTNTVVMNVNYRHTPESTFPAPVEDTWDALNWITRSTDEDGIDESKIIIGGTSAGANLSCATTLRELENKGSRIKGVILTIPPTVHHDLFPHELVKDGFSSLEQNVDAPVLALTRVKKFMGLYKPDPAHRFFSPLLLPDEAFRGFPPTCFHVAGLDPLRDEGLLFEEKLRRAGIKTKLEIYPGFPHGFMGIPQLKESEKWRGDLYRDIRWLIERSGGGQ